MKSVPTPDWGARRVVRKKRSVAARRAPPYNLLAFLASWLGMKLVVISS
jgi:hypothetical protein